MAREPGLPDVITIDGQEYTVRFSLFALKSLQKDHGLNLLKPRLEDLSDPEKLALILYYGLRDENPTLTLDWVEKHVDTRQLRTMMVDLAQAIGGNRAEAAIPNAPTPALSGTGSPSGASDDTTSVLVNGRSGV